MGGGGTTMYSPSVPGYQRQIGWQMADMMKSIVDPQSGMIKDSGYNTSAYSPLQAQTFAQARQFGATGMQPFIDTITKMSQGQNKADTFKVFDDAANLDFQRMSQQAATQMGATGVGAGTGFQNMLGRALSDTLVQTAKEKATFGQAADTLQLSAANMGTSAIPGMFQSLAGLGQQQRQVQQGGYQDWLSRLGVTQGLLGSGGSPAMNQSSQQPTYSTSPDQTGAIASSLASIMAAVIMAVK